MEFSNLFLIFYAISLTKAFNETYQKYGNDGENYNDQIMMMTHNLIHIEVMAAGLMPMDGWPPMGGRPTDDDHDDHNYHDEDSHHNEDSHHDDHKGHDDHNYHDNQDDHND